MSLAMPKPGRALWAVMIAITAIGVLTAFLATWVPGGERAFLWLDCEPARAFAQPWRLLTSGLLTSPMNWGHLLFSLAGLYFLAPPLEKRWGTWRFARLLAIAVILGNLVTIAVDRVAPPGAQPRFHPQAVFGPGAAIAAIAIGWAREYADSTVNLFFVLPMRAKAFFWITIAFCVLDLVYPEPIPEGVVAPFGGVIAGLLFAGTPSLSRIAWLRLRLLVLRRRAGSLRIEDVLEPTPKRRPRPGSPPLRVVSGGLEQSLEKRPPPKDKRFLN
jgi:membrane associated rhomboid family serine protease